MKKPEDYGSGPDFSEYMWMAEDGAEEGLQQQVNSVLSVLNRASCHFLLYQTKFATLNTY